MELWNGGFVTYIGSANLTHPAFFQNKEWMLKSTDIDTANHVYREFLNEWQVLSKQYMDVQDLTHNQVQNNNYYYDNMQDYNSNMNYQGQQFQNQQNNLGLGSNYNTSNGSLDFGMPMQNQQPNLYQQTQMNNQNGFSIGTFEGQDVRVGNGQFLGFLKSLFS